VVVVATVVVATVVVVTVVVTTEGFVLTIDEWNSMIFFRLIHFGHPQQLCVFLSSVQFVIRYAATCFVITLIISLGRCRGFFGFLVCAQLIAWKQAIYVH